MAQSDGKQTATGPRVTGQDDQLQTALCDIDGEKGRLVIAGHDIESIAGRTTYEDICGLLWHGALPDPAARETTRRALGEARASAFRMLDDLGNALDVEDGMDALRAATAHLETPTGEPAAKAARLAGALPVFAAAWYRGRQGQKPVAPDPTLPHAADYLRMVRGERGAAVQEDGLATYLVTVSEHGMNASTYTARVIASTGSDLVSSIVGAIGALKGPLHGGAPGPVLDMLDAVGHPDRARPWIEAELTAGRRIMGMGHRVYKVRDPRAAVLEKAVEALEKARIGTGRLALARSVERTAEKVLAERYPGRRLSANVEFYTAVLLEAVGLDRRLFSPTFGVGRVAGWCAHVAEQRAKGRLIRPSCTYIGPRVA